MRVKDIRPGVIIEWPHTPDFSVVARLVIDRTEDGYAWLHHEHTNTINRLSIPAILRHARLVEPAEDDPPVPADDDDFTEAELWWALIFIVVVILVIVVYYGKN